MLARSLLTRLLMAVYVTCSEEPTELELRAADKKGKRPKDKGFQPKRNVRKGKSRKR